MEIFSQLVSAGGTHDKLYKLFLETVQYEDGN